MAKSKWGHAVKLQKGLRIVQRLSDGAITWYREMLVDGRQVRVSLGTSDQKEAIRKAIAEPAGPEEGPAPRTFLKSKAPEALTVGKALEEYEKWYEEKNKASSAAVTMEALEKFVDFVGSDRDTRALTREHVEDFLALKKKLSPIYVRNQYGRIRGFLRRISKRHKGAVDLACLDIADELPDDDSTGKEIPDETTARNALRKLAAHSWLGEYVKVLFETGMRPSELLAVRGVDFEGAMLRIEPWGTWSPKSKWSKRTIQLNAAAAEVLEARKKQLFDKRAPIFGLPTGEMRTVKYVSKQYREALGKDAEFKLLNLYCWKHLFCSFHGAPGPQFMELQTLAAYIGHGPGSTRVLERWYANREAMRRGAPPALTAEAKETKVVPMKAT